MPRRKSFPPSPSEYMAFSRLPEIYFDGSTLAWAASFFGDAVVSALKTHELFQVLQPTWKQARTALAAHYALGKSSHALAVGPHLWASYREPQITGGFVHFLTSQHQDKRIVALLRAVGISVDELRDDQITGTAAIAEARTSDGERIDILAYAIAGRSRYGTVIEAKFDHLLSTKQLQVYTKAATDIHRLSVRRRRLLVVAPRFSAKTSKPLKAFPEWHFVTWERFLVRYEEALPASADCDDFARFRRTIWHRAGHG